MRYSATRQMLFEDSSAPSFVLVTGGAGVGKNHFIANDPRLKNFVLIDVDVLKKHYPTTFVRVLKQQLEDAMKRGDNIAHPTIGGSAAGNINKLKLAKSYGYQTEVIFLDGDSKRGIENNALRAASGGHSVPDKKIELTYQKAKQAFPEIAKHADRSKVINK